MRSGFLAFCLSAFALAGCEQAATTPVSEPGAATLAQDEPAVRPRFDAAAIDAARAELLKEPRVVDLQFDAAPLSVTWQIGTLQMSKPAYGYAEYVCLLLKERGLVDQDTSVRIVDLANPAAQTGDFRAGSLGQVRCADGTRLEV